jgi:RNA polymerase sigma-70 factor (ECF subfamily)
MGQDNENLKKRRELDLIERAKTDSDAFEELYDDYFPHIYGFIFKRTGQRETAEDIVSVIFIKVFTCLNQYKEKKCSFKSWVYTIALNTLIDHYRKHSVKNEVVVEEFPEIIDDRQDQVQGLISTEDQRMVREVLKKLPVAYQKILNLKFFSELSNREISEILAISPNHVGVLLYRALKKFKKVYQNHI